MHHSSVVANNRREKSKTTSSNFNPAQFLSFYSHPPTEELTVDQFEILSLDRLQLLRGIDNIYRTKEQNPAEEDAKEKEIIENKLKEVDKMILPFLFVLILVFYSWKRSIF